MAIKEKSQINETQLQREIMVQWSAKPGARLWRNNVGTFYTRDGRVVKCGLCPGSSDLIGFRPVTVTLDMVGSTIAQFCAVEVKSDRGKLSQAQKDFLDLVARCGGYGVMGKPGLE